MTKSKRLAKIFLLSILLALTTLVLLGKSNNAKALSPPNCHIANAVVDGNQVSSADIPANKPFSLLISCRDIAETGFFQASINGVTRPDQPFVVHRGQRLNESFGVFPAQPTPTGVPFTPLTVIITLTIPGSTSVDANCDNCLIAIRDHGIPPQATPTPGNVLNCPQFRTYNPNPPVSGQNVQIQFSIPQNANINNYRIVWQQPSSGHSNTGRLTDASAFGVWVFNLSSVSEFTTWNLYRSIGGQLIQCASGDIFFTSPSNPAGPGGSNPCASGTCNTALGPISTDITTFAGRVLSIAIGIAGGIALILLVFGSIKVLTSSGDQQRLAGGRDTIIAAIAGLLFLIFSVLILKAVGVAIGIPL